MDLMRDLPVLRRSIETLSRMTYPSGNYITVDDTHWQYTRGAEPPQCRVLGAEYQAARTAARSAGRPKASQPNG